MVVVAVRGERMLRLRLIGCWGLRAWIRVLLLGRRWLECGRGEGQSIHWSYGRTVAIAGWVICYALMLPSRSYPFLSLWDSYGYLCKRGWLMFRLRMKSKSSPNLLRIFRKIGDQEEVDCRFIY